MQLGNEAAVWRPPLLERQGRLVETVHASRLRLQNLEIGTALPQSETHMKRLIFWLCLVSASAAASTVNPNAIRAAAAYSNSQGGTSFLAIQNGKVLLEQSANKGHKIYSGTKAFWGLAALAAAEDGLLSLDENVADTIPAWRSDPRKARVTIRQLLDFSCGLEPVFYLHNDNPGDRDRDRDRGADRRQSGSRVHLWAERAPGFSRRC